MQLLISINGHSQGGDNIMELFSETQEGWLTADLVITLDIMDSRIGYNDTDNVNSNIKNLINYRQVGEFFRGPVIHSWDIKGETNVINKEAPGSNHRSIDNDLLRVITEDIINFVNGKDFMKIAKERKLKRAKKPKESTIMDGVKEKTSG